MRKTLLLIILVSTSIIFYGCNKNSNEDSPVSLSSIDISSKLDDKTLIISCNTKSSSKNSNKLYVVREKNATSSKEKNVFFDTILLKIHDKEVPFNSI